MYVANSIYLFLSLVLFVPIYARPFRRCPPLRRWTLVLAWLVAHPQIYVAETLFQHRLFGATLAVAAAGVVLSQVVLGLLLADLMRSAPAREPDDAP